MYSLGYLPLALQDMQDIVRYISFDLSNPSAAKNLASALVEAAEGLVDFPYSAPAFSPIRPLKREYRKLLVQNYFIFYWVDEGTKSITVARVIYARRNYETLL